VKLLRCPAPILIEIKRPASRKITQNSGFEDNLRGVFQDAENDVLDQAHYLLSKTNPQPSVILIACSGQYWKWRIVNKAQIAAEIKSRQEEQVIARRHCYGDRKEGEDDVESNDSADSDYQGAKMWVWI